MGTRWSNYYDRCGAGKTAIGLAGASLLDRSGRFDQGDDMVCDHPATSVDPSNSACIAGGEENFKEPVNCAPGEKTAGWLPGASFSSGMFNYNVVDSGVRSDLSDFVSYLIQRGSAGGENSFQEYRNFSPVVEVVNFLRGKNAELIKEANLKIADLKATHWSEVTTLDGKHEQQVTDSEARAQGKIQELSRNLEKASHELSDAQAQVRSSKSGLNSAQSELLDREKAVRTMQTQLDEEAKQKQELSKHRDILQKNMDAQRSGFEAKLRHSQEAGLAKDREVQRLNVIIEEKIKAAGNMEAATIQLTSECQKLRGQLAIVEQKSAQESLTSGSYPDDFANPGMLVSACQSVDRATDSLARFLHGLSVTKLSLNAPELESFIGKISPARLADFSRPAHVKHVWGHWICRTMFQGFEHVFFDTDENRTSPLDSKKHAAECFQSFQQNKNVSPLDYYKGCVMFRAFCVKMYSLVFPVALVNEGLNLDSVQLVAWETLDGRFDGDEELHLRFLDVAKAIWLLHKLSFSFDPPASILRMGSGTAFDKQYHEPLIKDAERDQMSSEVLLMVRPAFRVRTSIIKSRVFLSKKLSP